MIEIREKYHKAEDDDSGRVSEAWVEVESLAVGHDVVLLTGDEAAAIEAALLPIQERLRERDKLERGCDQ